MFFFWNFCVGSLGTPNLYYVIYGRLLGILVQARSICVKERGILVQARGILVQARGILVQARGFWFKQAVFWFMQEVFWFKQEVFWFRQEVFWFKQEVFWCPLMVACFGRAALPRWCPEPPKPSAAQLASVHRSLHINIQSKN